MAAVLDVTWGGATANSYASVAESNAYHEKRLHTSTWISPRTTPEATKNSALIWATSLIDQLFEFDGTKISTAQNLSCPRHGMLNREGWMEDQATKPQWIINATAEYAYWLVQEDLLQQANSDQSSLGSTDLLGFKEIRVGSITLKSSIGESKTSTQDITSIIPNSVLLILMPYGKLFSKRNRRLVR